jgi:probable H4MPT-linked C1 transfer pathway protein
VNIDLIGWDIGGAHVKAVALQGDRVHDVLLRACPLWQGLHHLDKVMGEMIRTMKPATHCRHVFTMSGEMVDLFPDRNTGVTSILHLVTTHCHPDNVRVFAGMQGFLPLPIVQTADLAIIASANWLATARYAAAHVSEALLIDVGSTTSDLFLIGNRQLWVRGYTDHERLRYDELVYTGVVRTSLMSFARRVIFEGEWVNVMAEHFASTADVYRLTGDLQEHTDQVPAADDGEKTREGSIRRLARLVGQDVAMCAPSSWEALALHFKEKQLQRLTDAAMRQLSRGLTDANIPIIGAGCGRFLVRELAERLRRPYNDFDELVSLDRRNGDFQTADCAPALAVAFLARQIA